jgi:hypothetical protein
MTAGAEAAYAHEYSTNEHHQTPGSTHAAAQEPHYEH